MGEPLPERSWEDGQTPKRRSKRSLRSTFTIPMQFRDIINSAAQLQNLKTTHMGHGALDTTIHRQLILLYLLSFVDGHSISFLLEVNITSTICDWDCSVFIVTAALHVYCYALINRNVFTIYRIQPAIQTQFHCPYVKVFPAHFHLFPRSCCDSTSLLYINVPDPCYNWKRYSHSSCNVWVQTVKLTAFKTVSLRTYRCDNCQRTFIQFL